jgi:hypothetical protein
MFFQIRTICTKLCGSPQRRSSFRRIAKRVCGGKKAPEELDPLQKHLDVGMLMVLRDVVTRWNSTHAMIRRSLILQDVSCWWLFLYHVAHEFIICQAIKKWVRKHDKLDHLKLSDDEWKLLVELDKLLHVSWFSET